MFLLNKLRWQPIAKTIYGACPHRVPIGSNSNIGMATLPRNRFACLQAATAQKLGYQLAPNAAKA